MTKSIIGIGVVTNKIIYPIITTIFLLFINLYPTFMIYLDSQRVNKEQYGYHLFFQTMLTFFTQSLILLFYLLSKKDLQINDDIFIQKSKPFCKFLL